MKNKKNWLIAKGVLLLFAVIIIVAEPFTNAKSAIIRYALLTFFILTYIIDVIDYKKKNG